MCYDVADTCPTFYFRVDQSTLNNDSPYSSWAWSSSATADNQYDNTAVKYRTINN